MKFLVLNLLSSIALAEAAAPTASMKDGLSPFIPLIMIFGVFYFLILRPQQRKQKEQQRFLTELKKGDMVVTASGIVGTIRTLSDRFVTLEVDDGVCLKMLRGQIAESAANLKDEKAVSGKEVPA
jgi:preprotein translocase subunit YajC